MNISTEYHHHTKIKEMIDFLKQNPLESLPGILLGVVLSFIQPIFLWIFCIYVLILFDHITGIRKAKHNQIPLESKKAKATVYKMFDYTILIIGAHVIDGYMFPLPEMMQLHESASYLTYPVVGFLAYREFWSILENSDNVTGAGLTEHMKNRMKKFKDKFK